MTFFGHLGMGPPLWGGLSFGLADFFADNASQKSPNHQFAGGEKLKATRLMGGFSWGRRAIRHVKSDELPAIARRATRNPDTEEPGKALRARFHLI